ncbi:MAG: cupin domain-containing protein, partial [Hungatella sp.]
MNYYAFYVDLPMMEDNFLFRVEDTVMKAPPMQTEMMQSNCVNRIYRSGSQIKIKKYDDHSLRFVLEELRQFKNAAYENCDLDIENLFFHCHNLYEVTVILSGRGYYFVNGQALEVSKGDVVVFNRLVPHAWLAVPGQAPQQWTFHFYPDLLLERQLSGEENSFIQEYLNHVPWIYEDANSSGNTLRYFNKIYREFMEKKEGYKTYINN